MSSMSVLKVNSWTGSAMSITWEFAFGLATDNLERKC